MAVWRARNRESKVVIRCRLEEMFGYSLQRSIDSICPGYRFDPTADGSVPEAIIAFLDSDSWEDAVRNCVCGFYSVILKVNDTGIHAMEIV
jgi:ADP-ribosylglycohydrolase